MVRRSSTERFERIEHLRDRITLHQGDLLDQRSLVGDASKARRELHWEPRTGFRELIELMVDADLTLLSR
jgi:nucleoside-diphosphate-sugar epimerase